MSVLVIGRLFVNNLVEVQREDVIQAATQDERDTLFATESFVDYEKQCNKQIAE